MTDEEALELVKLAFPPRAPVRLVSPRPVAPAPPRAPWTDLRHWVARHGAQVVDWIAAAGGHTRTGRIPRAYLPTRLKSEPEALGWLLQAVAGAGFTVWQVDDDMPWPRDTPFGPTLPPDPQPKPPGTPTWRPRP
jgi:hypothetical protein